MRKQNLVALSVILLSVVIGATPTVVKETSVQHQSFTFDASVNVTEPSNVNKTELGVNPDPELHFGTVPRATNVTKYLDISVATGSKVRVSSSGNISDMLYFDREIYVKDNSTLDVEMKAKRTGYYEGEVKVRVRRPLNQLGNLYLDLETRVENAL